MARKKRPSNKPEAEVKDYRHGDATRKNNPPAGIASHATIREKPKQVYAYNPHLPPVLRFDESGGADRLPALLEKAQQEALSADEVKILAAALRHQDPWLEWAGKQEAKSFAVDPVALHIHERVSTQAIVKAAQREDVYRELFADPQQEYHEVVQSYQHDVDWSNRLILGDSLTVMSSLAHREDLAGKVQMIYVDPPYGIKFASNFQPTVFQRDVKDKASDLTREPEQIKAYRDTWTLGVHSYLAYLRDRLIVARDLLTDSGSVFMQISDENVHRVRCLMDEVFGAENFVGEIVFKTQSTSKSNHLSLLNDFILWYTKDQEQLKFHALYLKKERTERFSFAALPNGQVVSSSEKNLPEETEVFEGNSLRGGASPGQPFKFRNRKYERSGRKGWSVTIDGLSRLAKADRIIPFKTALNYKLYYSDFPYTELGNLWGEHLHEQNKQYVVQTNQKIIERCMLMTTDPGDLVLDPTCGGGTTAYVAEQWGRHAG